MSEDTEQNPVVNNDEDKDNMISKLISEKKMIKERNIRLASLLNIITKKISDTNNASSNINSSGLSGIEDNITLLKKQMSGIERMFEKSTVDSKVDDLNKAMSDLNSRVESIEGSLSPVHRLEGIENKLGDVESLIRLHKRTGDNPFGMLGNVGSKDISDMYKDVEKPRLSEDIVRPKIHKTKAKADPNVPEDNTKSDASEDTAEEDPSKTEANPEVPDDEVKSDVSEDTAVQDSPKTEADPEVPEDEVKSDASEDTAVQDTTKTEANPEVPDVEVKSDASEDTAAQDTTKTEADPKVPDDEVKSDVSEDTAVQDTTKTEADPEVPEDEVKSDASEDTIEEDPPKTEANPEVFDDEVKSDVSEDTAEEPDSADQSEEISDEHPKHEHHIGFGMLKNILNHHTSDSKNKQKTSQIKPEPSAPKRQSLTPKDKPEPNTHRSGTSSKYDSVFGNKNKKQAKDELKKKTSSETKIKPLQRRQTTPNMLNLPNSSKTEQ